MRAIQISPSGRKEGIAAGFGEIIMCSF